MQFRKFPGSSWARLPAAQQRIQRFDPEHLRIEDPRRSCAPPIRPLHPAQAYCPNSFDREVTGLVAIPQGTMSLKWSRSVLTFRAKPWEVIPREMCTPMAAILACSKPAGRSCEPASRRPSGRARAPWPRRSQRRYESALPPGGERIRRRQWSSAGRQDRERLRRSKMG